MTADERTDFLRGLADDLKRWKFGYDVQPTHVMVRAIEVLLGYVAELEQAVVALSELRDQDALRLAALEGQAPESPPAEGG
jgi:hypothetical protein